ncbi:hypothetical protein [Chamaesiphon minutus]|nr:hypothetical protein [Chamaesiphon minutus]
MAAERVEVSDSRTPLFPDGYDRPPPKRRASFETESRRDVESKLKELV